MVTQPGSQATTYQRVKQGFTDLGYLGGLLREDYQFADILAPNFPVRTIPLAAFAQEPPSYHSACFGVVSADGQSGLPLVSSCRSLGAAQILEITDHGLQRWGMLGRGDPVLLDQIGSHQVPQFFDSHKHDWSPNNLGRVKSALREQPISQLDFFDVGLLPLLDHEVRVKLDKLLTRTITLSVTTFERRFPSTTDVIPPLFRLIFRLIAAKLLADRQHPGRWLQDDPRLVIQEVEGFYFKREKPEPVLQDYETQVAAWESIRSAFRFQNLSVEALAYVYENTLMTREIRRAKSTHGTDPAIAEYIVRHLPFESLEENDRRVFEPFSGHAVFLVAALRRLRGLLPSTTTPDERHAYFVRMLYGLESEDFAREVARLSLMLADYPNPDGWHLHRGDAFQSDILNRELSLANVVLCNPPFEDFTTEEQARYADLALPHKPAAILHKVLEKPPKLLGFVLPRVFVFGRGYRHLRNVLGNTYSSIEVLALPDNVFKHSGAETVLLIASGTKTDKLHLTVGEVYKGRLESFYSKHRPSYQAEDNLDVQIGVFDQGIWLPVLREIWEATAHLKCLRDIAEVHRGIEYNLSLREYPNEAISKEKHPGFSPGLHRVSDGLEPFFLSDHKYLNISPDIMRTNAYTLPWHMPKVIMNARRRTAGPWKITAAPDYDGLYCYQSFDGVWPTDGMSPKALAAVLNGPVANAFVAAIEGQRDIRVQTIRNIPIPSFSSAQEATISQLVDEYREIRSKWILGTLDALKAQKSCKATLQRIDAEVLKAYDLSPRLERMLLDYFMTHQRPGPVQFTEYFPETFQPWIPWHLYISQDFHEATARATLERLPVISDPLISRALSDLD